MSNIPVYLTNDDRCGESFGDGAICARAKDHGGGHINAGAFDAMHNYAAMLQERPRTERQCDYSAGGNVPATKRCAEPATFERHTRQGPMVRVTFACEAHRFPKYQSENANDLWAVPR